MRTTAAALWALLAAILLLTRVYLNADADATAAAADAAAATTTVGEAMAGSSQP